MCVYSVQSVSMWGVGAMLGLRLAVMNPCLLFGPMLQPALNTSSKALLPYATGALARVPLGTKCVVDVRDVAEAHVRALEPGTTPWGNRFVLIASSASFAEWAAAVAKALPEGCRGRVPVEPSSEAEPNRGMGAPSPHPTLFDASKAEKELGVRFRGTEEMVVASVQSLIRWGFVEI